MPVLEELSSALAGVRPVFSDFVDLLGLEAERALLALILIVACAAASALLAVAAWIVLMAALAMTSAARIGWEASLGLVGIATVIAAAALFWLGARATRSLTFPAMRRQLRPQQREAA